MGNLILVSKEWKENLRSALCTLQPSKDITDEILYDLCISFPNIKSLELVACKHLTGVFLLELGEPEDFQFTFEDVLKYISYAKRQAAIGISLGMLGSLEILDLTGCQRFPPHALIHIAGLKNLKKLVLQNQDVTDQLVLGIAKNLGALEHLELSDCPKRWGDNMSIGLVLLLSTLHRLSFWI